MPDEAARISGLIGDAKVLLFDFDGTVADTEPLHWAAYRRCLEPLGVVLDASDIARYVGRTERTIYAMIRDDFGITFDEDAFLGARTALFMQFVDDRGLEPFPYVRSIMALRPSIAKFIVSSQRDDVIRPLLARWDLADRFDDVFSAPASGTTKQRILSTIAAHTGHAPADTVLFEDHPEHLAFASTCGFRTVAVVKRSEAAAQVAGRDAIHVD